MNFQEHSKDLDETLKTIIDNLDLINRTRNHNLQKELDNYTAWMQKCLTYNVGKGKKMRGQLVITTFLAFVPNPAKEERFLALVLGCIVELLHAAFLVADDIMDKGETRRGRKCWYLKIGNEAVALNDSFALENLSYQILKTYFGHLQCYGHLLDLMLSVSYKTILGQGMDTASETKNLVEFTESLYTAIATYKTGYYTVYLPVALAMTLAGIDKIVNDKETFHTKVQNVCLEIGLLFQAQDDMLDLFGDPSKTGKTMGTDVGSGKCTWLLIQAQKHCTSEQLKRVYENYGKSGQEKITIVKQIYEDVKIPQLFESYENAVYQNIHEQIADLKLPAMKLALNSFLDRMCFRKC